MKSLMSLHVAILAFFLFGMLASAMDLVFFPRENSEHCSTSAVKEYIACKDSSELFCCQSRDPFCARGALLKSNGWTHTIYLSAADACQVLDGEPWNRCITSSSCCINGPVKNTPGCSMYWHFGEPSPDPNNPPHVISPERRDEACGEPDLLSYTTDDGTQRKISIPEGEFELVMEMYSRRDLEGLGRYETLQEDGE